MEPIKIQYNKIVTSEAVSEGHPDKVADLVADCILDDIRSKDPDAHVAVEVMVSKGVVIVGGEVKTTARFDVDQLARKALSEAGYKFSGYYQPFSAASVAVMSMINCQSPEIDEAVKTVDGDGNINYRGAGDQGIMFGYATRETNELMPMPIVFAQHLMKRASNLRREGKLKWAKPDMKCQVSVAYCDDKPVAVDAVVMAVQHSSAFEREMMRHEVIDKVLIPTIEHFNISMLHAGKFLFNKSGSFSRGGPEVDTGVTGRKNVADTYGGFIPHGGGAISGKDVTKVDRIGQYMARYIAVNLVKANVAFRCQVQLAYVIGMDEPVAVSVDTFSTGEIDDDVITRMVEDIFDCTVSGILNRFNEFRDTEFALYTNFGQFGREAPWEKPDMVEEIREYAREKGLM